MMMMMLIMMMMTMMMMMLIIMMMVMMTLLSSWPALELQGFMHCLALAFLYSLIFYTLKMVVMIVAVEDGDYDSCIV